MQNQGVNYKLFILCLSNAQIALDINFYYIQTTIQYKKRMRLKDVAT
jgi:hypothetical protein